MTSAERLESAEAARTHVIEATVLLQRPSVASLELSAMTTSPVGCEFRTIVKAAVPPDSVVVRPVVGVTVMPDASLSALVTVTSGALIPL